MIKHLKIYNYKGIEEVILKNLGQLNVICGKNNSGKTSILEGLCKNENRGIGMNVESVDWLNSLFKPYAEKYTNPDPSRSKKWFDEFANELETNKTILYSDDPAKNINLFTQSMKEDHYLGRYNTDTFNFNQMLNSMFSKSISNLNTLLVPPKRNIESTITVKTDQIVTPDGNGLTNRLFYLKNQDVDSREHKTYTKISKSFTEITGFEFNIFTLIDNKISLNFRLGRSNWNLAEHCGMGLSDVLVMLCIALDSVYSLILIEEPESHLHPEMQKKLLEFIKGIKNKQFLLSTHSSVFLNPFVVDRIFYTVFNDKVSVSDETSKSEILYNLGYSVSENIVSDVIILTEGPTDIPILSTIADWIGFGKTHNIKYWPLGGDIMADLDLSIFAEKRNVYALIDSDPGSSVIRTRFLRKCKEQGIKCHKLKRYSIENYLSIEAIKSVFGETVPTKLTELDENKSVDEQLKIKNKRTIKTKNREIISFMKIEDLKGTDLLNFLLQIDKYLKELER